jgi:hypothetical protein
MAATFVIDGLDDLKRALRDLPEVLTDDAGDLVRAAAQNAAGGIRAGYAKVKGNLQNGVAVVEEGGARYGVRYRVRSKAPHAYLYEYGTQARHYITEAGKRHATGIMPAAPPGRAFVPKMIDARARLYDELGWLLVRNGLAVRRAG